MQARNLLVCIFVNSCFKKLGQQKLKKDQKLEDIIKPIMKYVSFPLMNIDDLIDIVKQKKIILWVWYML